MIDKKEIDEEQMEKIAIYLRDKDVNEFCNIIDDLDPELIAELSQKAEEFMKKHNISREGDQGLNDELWLMGFFYRRKRAEIEDETFSEQESGITC